MSSGWEGVPKAEMPDKDELSDLGRDLIAWCEEQDVPDHGLDLRDWGKATQSELTNTDLQAFQFYKRPNYKHYQLPEDQDWVPVQNSGGRAKRCKAETRRGTRCMMPATKGYDVCRHHGAGSKEKPGGIQKWKRDLYKLEKNTDLQDKAERFLNDPRLDEMDSDLAYMQALFEMAADQDINGRALIELLEKINKAKKRKKDVENHSAMTQKEFQMLMNALLSLIKRYVPEKNQSAFISDLDRAIGS